MIVLDAGFTQDYHTLEEAKIIVIQFRIIQFKDTWENHVSKAGEFRGWRHRSD